MMTEFYSDIAFKKKAARGASHRKRGSKSRSCHLSTDYMTQKEWEQRNGEIITYNPNKPMSWAEFLAMPPHIQAEYLEHLNQTYQATIKDIAWMFDVNPRSLRKLIRDNELSVVFPAGHHMNQSIRPAWETFVARDTTPPPAEATPEAPSYISESPEEDCMQPPTTPPSPMRMRHFMLCFEGELDPDAIANSLRRIVGERSAGRIDITCDLG